MKVLWLSPSFNHYKAKFLNYLAQNNEIELTVLSGTGRVDMGDREIDSNWFYTHDKVEVEKAKFGLSLKVREYLTQHISSFDWVLIPAEKKNLLLFVYLMYVKKSKTKLFSYNHPILKTGSGKVTFLDKILTKFFYKNLDKVIFYTENSRKWAVESNYLNKNKAFWANNTINTIAISKHYSFCYPPKNDFTILFIGRLIETKKVADLIKYFNELKQIYSKKDIKLTLEIIGDGPDADLVKNAQRKDLDIKWHGAIVDETLISPIMTRSSIVFVPGLSGLSINHAFAYGRPYVTCKSDFHGPEIGYLTNKVNGLILSGNIEADLSKLKTIIEDYNFLKSLCDEAFEKGKDLSIDKWVSQIILSLKA